MYNARPVLGPNPIMTVTPALVGHADLLIVNMKGVWETIRRLGIIEGIRVTDYHA